MSSTVRPEIVIRGAKTNNLQDISLHIPHHQLIVVTGVSGSGKSSLVFEIIAKEGQRRYFETLPSFARQFTGKLNRPEVDQLEGLSPVIAIGQRTTGIHARSTVGTLSDIYDLLRLLFARTGTTDKELALSRSLFSFNSLIGQCKRCRGIGKEEQIDLNRLISSPEKTIREGALAPTLPNGYIMYSQVTIDVLNQVCKAEGFNVDIPWNELTEQQRAIILHGSTKIKVPFGKHSLESRLKWKGIKAKPREEGHYKGMIPIMSDILRRDRNANILKYVQAVTCPACQGHRLNEDARSVQVQGKSITDLTCLELNELQAWIKANSWGMVAQQIVGKLLAQLELMDELGLGHLTINRSATSLRTSEIQRIRVANQLLVPLSNVLYVFDEPSIGLHRKENASLIYHFKQLVKKGNTVIVVEHDLDTIASADHIIDLGPGAGIQGGQLLYNGAFSEFMQAENLRATSATYRALQAAQQPIHRSVNTTTAKAIRLLGCHERNLKNIDVSFQLGQLNVVSGESGVGKASLVRATLLRAVRQQLGLAVAETALLKRHENLDAIDRLIFIDHSPIGKTPRSNPATYLGISDHIRDVFANLPESKKRGFTKSRFSFNNKGGRCENCQGAGKTQIGMHFLGNIDLLCGTCGGDRFNEDTLQIKYKNHSIAGVYKLSVNEAIRFFEGQKKILAGLKILQEIGLGYLTLGQSSTTLSGGEAQRIKIANQLQKKDTGNTLYVIIEPSIGLHHKDIQSLLQLFTRIKQKGNTIVCIEQDETIIGGCDWHIELGPKSGKAGGYIVHQGTPKSPIAGSRPHVQHTDNKVSIIDEIVLNGVCTHRLKNIDVRIPKNQLTVVTGLSGSGKSSLVYDTLFAEANARFTESLSTYNRSFLKQNSEAQIDSFSGLGPAIGINRKGGFPSKRSTVGTLSGIYDAFRLLYSRIAQQEEKNFTAQHFSFNHHLGACPACEGLGSLPQCDPGKVIVSADQSILDGAISTNKAIAYYADPNGQFIATLQTAAQHKGWNIDRPWQELDNEIKDAILYGTGDIVWEVNWTFRTKARTGTQALQAKWLGFCHYINEEYQRKRHNKSIKQLEELLHQVVCPACGGSRLKPVLLNTHFLGKDIHEMTQLSMESCLDLMTQIDAQLTPAVLAISEVVLPSVRTALKTIVELGLGYLSLDRAVHTLSGGERQRLTLASQLSSQLFGVIYVLDEPTIGLDGQQIAVLSQVLKRIVENGNTVVVVEHDPDFIQRADYLIELGPGAGSLGGEVIYQGNVNGAPPTSITYRMLHAPQLTKAQRQQNSSPTFGISGAFANNLQHIDVDFHTQQITAITGVSGSGKSSLIKEVLYQSCLQKRPVNCSVIHGLEHFEEVLLIDQEIVAQNRLTTPVSYTGILDPIKKLFAKTEVAQQAGLKSTHFSYQSKQGKCAVCNGYGQLKTSMDFMSDLWLRCDHCIGMRYNNNVLACTFQGRSIGEVLQMTVQEAIVFFDTPLNSAVENRPTAPAGSPKQGRTKAGLDEYSSSYPVVYAAAIVKKLNILRQVGLGHLLLGQSGHTLSGGEAQRLKLAKAMLRKRKGATLYLFDEPSTGLHYFDILPLISVFQALVDYGDTVLFIEHNRTLIEVANQVVRLGPGSGDEGGSLVGELSE